MEDSCLGHATERIFLPLIRLTLPEIVDYHMPAYGIFHNLVFVSIDKQYPGQAYKVMNARWGAGLMSLAKVIVVVDKDVEVRDPDKAWWITLNNIDPGRDVAIHAGPRARDRTVMRPFRVPSSESRATERATRGCMARGEALATRRSGPVPNPDVPR
jgi:UbiD family decarboxylase